MWSLGGASCRAATGSKLLTIGRYSTILLKQDSRLWTNQGIFGAHMVDIVIAKATGSPWSEVLGHPEGHLNGQDRRTFGPWHLSLGANIGFAYREDINEKKRFLSGIARIRGGVYPCPNFLALFLEVHFLSIKRVYFFKNASEAVWQGASGRCRAYSFKGTTTNYLYFKGTQHTLTSSTSPSRGHTPTIFTTPSRGHTVHTH